MFATHGLTKAVVSDNGNVFTSSEFQKFMVKNGIQHIHPALYHHPATYRLAKRAVQTLKEGLRKPSDRCLKTNLSWVLFQYHSPPDSRLVTDGKQDWQDESNR